MNAPLFGSRVVVHFGIRAQLLFPLAPLVLGLAATTAWSAHSAAAAARDRILFDLNLIADTVRRVTFPRNAQTLRLMKGLSGADLLLCDIHGEPLVDDQRQPLTTLASVPESLPEPDDAGEPIAIRIDSVDYLSRGVRLQHDRLYLFLPASVLDDAVARAVRPALAIGGIGGAASVLLALWITQRLTRRIQDLRHRTSRIAAGDLRPAPQTHRGDELGDLAQSINDMAGQLARLQESQKTNERLRLLGQVSGGLAHQLRNGIAGARLALQLHARSDTSSAVSESLRVALRQLAIMENYLRRFLDLGKAIEPRLEDVDLRSLIEETADLLRPQCVHANIDLRVEADGGPVRLPADPDQLRQALFNLVSNAVEAAGPGGRVDIRLRVGGDSAIVDVIDSGPGVPPDVAARLFEPFVTGKPEGVGLGLAVAKQIAQAHRGELTWSRESEATRFRLELPARPTAITQ